MISLTITPATESEREWAAQLMANSEPWITLGRGLEQCRKALSYAEDLLFIARAGDKPSGLMLLRRRGLAGAPYIASLAVAPDFRSQGLGSPMLAFAEDSFRPESPHIFLCVSSFNLRARQLYERLGYSVVGEFKDYVIPDASE